jgi:hypothetical protein
MKIVLFVGLIPNIIGTFLCCKDIFLCCIEQNLWLQIETQMLQVESFKEFFTNILRCFNEARLITLAMTA